MIEKQRGKKFSSPLIFLILLVIPLLFRCGEEPTGGVAFDIVWDSASGVSSASSYQPQALPSGVVTLRVTVSASDMDDLVKNYSNLNPAGGKIKILGIKPGTNRSALVEGLDANDAVTHSGTLSGITIEKGKITSAGTVILSVVNPTNNQNLPEAPGNLQGSVVSSSQILLTWADNSDDETAFRIERKEGASGSWGYVNEVTANVTSYMDAGLACETGYNFRVRAYNNYGDSEYSNQVTKTTNTCPTSAPAAPTTLASTVSSASQINLSWKDNSNNEDGFKVERKTGSAGTYAEIGTVGSGVASYQDTGLDCEKTYYYRVRAFNGVGDSSNSNEVNATTSTCPLTAPTAPSGLTAAVISSTQINIYWIDNSNNETGFKVERKTGSSGTYSQVATVGGGVKTYSDTGLTCGSTYYYRVRAYNSVGDSGYTSEANGVLTCSVTVPTAPSNLQATVVSSSQIDLAWTDNSSNEEGFKVERKTGTGGTYAVVKTTSSNVTTYSDTGLTAGTIYYYRVYSYNSAGNSGYSSEANATTQNLSGPMVSIPAGCFNMGDALGDADVDELPVHNVCISAFSINTYEVTNARYKACVDASVCSAPGNSTSNTRSPYYGNSTYNNYPVIYVNWNQAEAFCVWAGGRLPTEAEWEYAARGGLAGKRYFWGDTTPTCTLGAANGANYDSCSPDDTFEVGRFTANGYGLYDMAGNVWEWCNDYVDGNYYSVSPTQDPTGPITGSNRVIRGGSWDDLPITLRVSNRDANPPTSQDYGYGIRCVK